MDEQVEGVIARGRFGGTIIESDRAMQSFSAALQAAGFVPGDRVVVRRVRSDEQTTSRRRCCAEARKVISAVYECEDGAICEACKILMQSVP